MNTKMLTTSQISKAFAKDFRCEDQSELTAYLAKHEENGVYQSFVNNQQALNLE